MDRQRSIPDGQAEENWSKKLVVGVLVAPLAALFLCGCSSEQKAPTSDPPAKLRMEKVLKFYQMYIKEKKKPPADEKAFKEYIRSLPQDQKEAAAVGDDVDSFLTSPADGQKIHIEYNMVPNPAQTRALAWEETGQNGYRWVALSMGYVTKYDEESLKNYKKKK